MVRVVYKWGKVLDMVTVIHETKLGNNLYELRNWNNCDIIDLISLSVLSFICMAPLNFDIKIDVRVKERNKSCESYK